MKNEIGQSKTNNVHLENASYFHFMHCKYEHTWGKNNQCSHRKTKKQIEEKTGGKKTGSAGVIIWYSIISARDLKTKLSAISNSSWHYLYFSNIFLSNRQHTAFTDIKRILLKNKSTFGITSMSCRLWIRFVA